MKLFIWIALLFPITESTPGINSIVQSCHAIQRDINLVHFLPIRANVLNKYTNLPECSRTKFAPFTSPADTAAFRHAIEQINADMNLLPNISLGFIVVDSCSNSLISLALSQYLVPDENDANFYPDNQLLGCAAQYKRFRNVVGTLGPGGSSNSVMTVPLLSLFEIPALLTFATSDELSDKARFPYSLRLMPPNRFQAEAMIELLHHFDWTYTTVLYSEGPYGENGAKQLQKYAKKYGICISFTYMIPSLYTDEHITDVVDKLIENQEARVILTFLFNARLHSIAKELIHRGFMNYFIWVTSDASHLGTQPLRHYFNGAFQVFYHLTENEEYRDYYHSLNPVQIGNPWLIQRWEQEGKCSWNDSSKPLCSYREGMPSKLKMTETTTTGIIHDGVSVYANALHKLIQDNCPQAFRDKTVLKDCIKGPLLLKYLKETVMIGYLGPIRFDENGDPLGYTYLSQYHHSSDQFSRGVIFNGYTREVEVDQNKLIWPFPAQGSAPDSVCSYPCDIKQYYIQKELPCCWECRECRNNEIIVNNQTGCQKCELFSWPDEDLMRECVPIPPTTIKSSDLASIILSCSIAVGGLLCLITATLLIKKSDAKILKASSLQLMSIILLGITVAFVTALVFLLKPSITTCFITRIGFNFSVSMIFGPLLVKTSRVYRIFRAGKTNKKPLFVSNRAQVVMVLVVLVTQVGLCIASVAISYPKPNLRMPIETVKYVEVHCSLPLPALLPPLSFNMLLSIICATFGFITRKLPENFNESWFIFVSVATTSFLWVVFLPAYFTAFYAEHQVILLASCLLINGLVTLVCLYLPKLYAVYFVAESRLNITSVQTDVTTVGATTNGDA